VYKGCPYQDEESLNIASHAFKMYSAITKSLNRIRRELKYNDELTTSERELLEDFYSTLAFEGLID